MALGLTEGADSETIKSAYKNLVKMYHPDVRSDEASKHQYQAISEAYEYLMSDAGLPDDKAVWAAASHAGSAAAGHRIFGTKEELNRMNLRMQSRADYARQEIKVDLNRKNRTDELNKKTKEMRREREFNEAMEKIHTERAAEVIAQIIRAYLLSGDGKEENSDV